MATFEGRFTDLGQVRIAVVVARFNDLGDGKAAEWMFGLPIPSRR